MRWFRCFLIDIKVILQSGQRHEAAHGEAGHVHKETKVPQVRHQRRIMLQFAGLQLRFEEGKQFYIFAVALGIGGIAFRVGNVLARFL